MFCTNNSTILFYSPSLVCQRTRFLLLLLLVNFQSTALSQILSHRFWQEIHCCCHHLFRRNMSLRSMISRQEELVEIKIQSLMSHFVKTCIMDKFWERVMDKSWGTCNEKKGEEMKLGKCPWMRAWIEEEEEEGRRRRPEWTRMITEPGKKTYPLAYDVDNLNFDGLVKWHVL